MRSFLVAVIVTLLVLSGLSLLHYLVYQDTPHLVSAGILLVISAVAHDLRKS